MEGRSELTHDSRSVRIGDGTFERKYGRRGEKESVGGKNKAGDGSTTNFLSSRRCFQSETLLYKNFANLAPGTTILQSLFLKITSWIRKNFLTDYFTVQNKCHKTLAWRNEKKKEINKREYIKRSGNGQQKSIADKLTDEKGGIVTLLRNLFPARGKSNKMRRVIPSGT